LEGGERERGRAIFGTIGKFLALFISIIICRLNTEKSKQKKKKNFICLVGPTDENALGHLRLGFTVLSLTY
jgi:hypothetical protein